MAKDHYVAQTYLRSFGLAKNSNLISVVRKSNLSRQNSIPVKSICYEIDWSSNEYFSGNPRVVEDFIKLFEPKWTDCVRRIESGTYDAITKYFMSGYLAYLRTCTPTAARLGCSSLSDIVKHLCDSIEEKEMINPETKYRDAIETIRNYGGIQVEIQKAFPKAMGINSLISVQKVLSTSQWIVFKNETEVQFLTSDNPVCLQYWNASQCDFYCPINPRLAIVIHPLRDAELREDDYLGLLKYDGVEMLNRLMVQSAEDKVIFNEYSGIEDLVREYQDWRVELQTFSIPVEKGNLIIHQQKPVKKQDK